VIQVCFFLGAIGTLGGAIAVIALRNPFYSVLALIVHLISLAGLFLLLQGEFLAAAQIVVYAGAVMVLYVFVAAYVGNTDEPLWEPIPGQRFIANLKIKQGQPHAFPPQLFRFDKPLAVAVPEFFVVCKIVFMKAIKIVDPFCLQFHGVVQFFQRLPAVGIKIPKRMVQVKEKMLVLHAARYETPVERVWRIPKKVRTSQLNTAV